jgi:GNAT superfamily N-acetyltransferase
MSESAEVRLLGAAELECYLEHMMRLDGTARAQRFAAGVDDTYVMSHCLHLIVARTSLIGAFVDGELRGAAELEVDDDGGTAELVLAVEKAWRGKGLGRALMRAAVDQAAARKVGSVRIDVDRDNAAMHRVATAAGFVGDGGRRTVTYQLRLAELVAAEPRPMPRWWNPFRATARTA